MINKYIAKSTDKYIVNSGNLQEIQVSIGGFCIQIEIERLLHHLLVYGVQSAKSDEGNSNLLSEFYNNNSSSEFYFNSLSSECTQMADLEVCCMYGPI